MTETNGHYVEPDLHRVIHGLHLELSSMASRFAEKDAQTRTMLQTIGKYVEDRIKLATAPLLKRIDELEKRGIDYRGIYQRAQIYQIGSMVTHDNNLYSCISNAGVNKSPGSHPSRWQMALRGREGDRPRQATQGGPRAETVVQRRA